MNHSRSPLHRILQSFLWKMHPAPNRKARRQRTAASVETLSDRVMLTALADAPHSAAEASTDEEPSTAFNNDSNRWSFTATDGGGLGQGDATTITWSIVADGTGIVPFPGDSDDDDSNLIAFLGGIYGVTTNDNNYQDEAWFSVFESVFDRFEELTGIRYVYVADDGVDMGFGGAAGLLGSRGDVRIGGHFIDGESGSNTLAYNYFPNNGDMVIDTANPVFFGNTSNNSLNMRNLLAHEHGHGIGLRHVESNDSQFLMEPFINTSFDGPQYDDIQTAQRLYGDRYEFAGNDTSGSAVSLGTLTSSNTLSIGTDGTGKVIAATDTDIVSIDDDSDLDFWSFTTGGSLNVNITLTPVGPTYNHAPQTDPATTQVSFNAAAQSDLTLQLIAADGTTVLQNINVNGVGGAETITSFSLPTAGTYFIRVSGAANLAQTYSLSVTADAPPANQPPVITNAQQKTFTIGTLTNGTVVFDVDATDPDGDNLTYSFDPTSPFNGQGAFSINAQTGVITVVDASLLTFSNFEDGGVFLDVLVTDDGTPSESVVGFFDIILEQRVAQDNIGVFRGGNRWYLDADGNGSWSGTGANQDKFSFFGSPSQPDTPITGDWNGDGITDIGIHRGNRFILDSDGSGAYNAGDSIFTFGLVGDTAIIGDWNGDGKDTIGIHRITNNQSRFYVDANGNGQWDGTMPGQDIYYGFGVAGDVPIAGDFNGNGIDTVGVNRVRNNENRFYLDANGNGQWDGNAGPDDDIFTRFGSVGQTAIVGDWNGDGTDTLGVHYTNATGSRFILDANGNGQWDGNAGPNDDLFIIFGVNNDAPVIGNWA